jgi:2-oxoglutarate dehydrogenase E2 component (dihydrolipoamide succinyltransferase)
MADPRDDRVSSAYRELPGEGPPPALDAAIQAAARRAVGSRPGGARRWQIPVSIAAVLALAIGVSLHVEREKPVVVDGTPVSSGSAEYPVPQAAPERTEAAAPAPSATPAPAPPSAPAVAPAAAPSPAPAPAPAAAAPEVRRMPKEQAAPMAEEKRFAADPAPAPPPSAASGNLSPAAPLPASPGPVPMPATTPPPVAGRVAPPPAAAGAAISADAVRAAPQAAKRAKSELAREATVQEKEMAGALDTPERRLERIADLRAKGLHDEADRELAEFRRAYPDYRIPAQWIQRVERR